MLSFFPEQEMLPVGVESLMKYKKYKSLSTYLTYRKYMGFNFTYDYLK